MLHLILERSQFDNPLVQAFWTVSLGFNPVVILTAMCLVIHWRDAPICRTNLCWYCKYKYHFMPNGNYSIDFQVYRTELFLHTWSSCFKNLRKSVCWWEEPFMQFFIDNKALTQVNSKLNTLALWSQIIWYLCENSAPHKQKFSTHARSMSWCNGFTCNWSLLARCLWQKDAIRVDAKCQTYVAYNDFFPVQRELLKDGILLCLQNCIFQLLYTCTKRNGFVCNWSFLTRCLWQKDVIRAHAKCSFPVQRKLLKDGILLCLQKLHFSTSLRRTRSCLRQQ